MLVYYAEGLVLEEVVLFRFVILGSLGVWGMGSLGVFYAIKIYMIEGF